MIRIFVRSCRVKSAGKYCGWSSSSTNPAAIEDVLVSAIASRLAPIEGGFQNAAPRPQRKRPRRALINLARNAQISGRVMMLITEDVKLREIPWIASLVHIVRTVGWQGIGTLSQMLSSRFLEADVAARAATALIARTLHREAFVLACRDAFLLFGVMTLVSILAALCFRTPGSPKGCSNSLIDRDPSMPIRTPSVIDDGRIRPRPIPAEVLQGE
jgi:hypothetical protein